MMPDSPKLGRVPMAEYLNTSGSKKPQSEIPLFLSYIAKQILFSDLIAKGKILLELVRFFFQNQ